MNILYLSVHQILEYDEIRMLKALGHTVFPLGVYFGFTPAEPFRPALAFGTPEHDMMEVFRASGCRYSYGLSVAEQVLSTAFIHLFDAVIVMHSIDFIERHWDVIGLRPVVWRTIGVNIEAEESRIAPFRARGCKIVRYSPMESLAEHYAGHDAIIRFAKVPGDFGPWIGDVDQVLVFSNQIKLRFPEEYHVVEDVLRGVPNQICGGGNEGVPNAVGLVPYETQIELLKSSRLYLYGVGTFITYTLNFMEAWMSGIPIVVLDGRAVLPPAMYKFAEIPSLIDSGKNGFMTSSAEEASAAISALRSDTELARAVGTAGRAAAMAVFGATQQSAAWNDLLSTLST